MFRQTCIWLLVIVLFLPVLSCARLPGKPAPEGVMVGTEALAALDSIPSEWGELISVTTHPTSFGWFQLWFEDESGIVRMVVFDFRNKRLDSNAIVLSRN